jgi:hypothetical protein
MKIANRDAWKFVQKQHPFEGSNLFAQVHTTDHPNGENGPDMWYVVYSFGDHWPLFVRANAIWFENEDRYSRTTTKHRTQTHPRCPTAPLCFCLWSGCVYLPKGGTTPSPRSAS